MASRRRSNKRRQDRRYQLSDVVDTARERAWRLAPWLLVALIALGLPTLVYQGYLFTVSSPHFSVQTIDVTGAQWMSRQEALTHAQLATGVNIFDVDEQGASERLRAHPWVASAQVLRALPDRVIVEIVEHQPYALLSGDGTMWLVDAQGMPFKTLDPERDPVDTLTDMLPLVSGLDPEALSAEGDPGEQARAHMRQAFDLLTTYQRLQLDALAALSEVHIDPVMGISLILLDCGAEVRLGWGRYEERLSRFRVVYTSLVDRGVGVDYILVDQQEDLSRVAVGLMDAAKEGSPRQ